MGDGVCQEERHLQVPGSVSASQRVTSSSHRSIVDSTSQSGWQLVLAARLSPARTGLPCAAPVTVLRSCLPTSAATASP
eukprot:549487-Hanusia_phi.AAC.7